ncbi:MAG: cupin domain-containing protein [Patescibacteria group bacterium]
MRPWQDLNQLIEYSSGGVLSRELIKTDKMSVTLFCLAEKTAISDHTATGDGFVYVIEGEGIFNLAGEAIPMGPAVLIEMPANAVHSLEAKKNTAFLLILFK